MNANAVPSCELPPFLDDVLRSFVGEDCRSDVLARLRPADELMTAPRLGAMKATRLSFANVLARRMIEQRWTIRRDRFSCDAEGDGYGVYRIDAAGHRLSYITRRYRLHGIDKVGRRSDGAGRDMFRAIFLGTPDETRIAEEFAVFNLRDIAHAHPLRRDRLDAGQPACATSTTWWTRSPPGASPTVLPGSGTGYILRNGGIRQRPARFALD